MVVLHRARGFRFVIYTQDHAPAHVHIVGDGKAKVDLVGRDGRANLVNSVGIRRAELKRLVDEVHERRDEFLAHWDRIHGRNKRG